MNRTGTMLVAAKGKMLFDQFFIYILGKSLVQACSTISSVSVKLFNNIFSVVSAPSETMKYVLKFSEKKISSTYL